jgi:type II secretory ATPase GspE/PulE/Tfp pilus assembly ATPase PilB-like protein
MDCKQAEALLVAYARGELSEDQVTELEGHLAECGHCQWNADAAKRTLDLLKESAEPDVVKLVTGDIQHAISSGASDIHFEPGRDGARVRLRVDGVLHEMRRIPTPSYPAVVARLHMMSECNPFELRVPQFGFIRVRYARLDHDLRVTFLPSTMGTRVTLRILPADAELVTLDQMGLSPEHLASVRSLLRQPNGLLVLAGPMGSGKTTTAYACLKDLVSPEIAVFTVEDPVAMKLDGATQMHLNHRQGLDYPFALKAVMQSDPDVIFVGEVRDAPTAAAACDLALTGHLVLTCMHADDAAMAVTRLVEVGMPPYTLAASLIGVVAQRLARKVCQNCKEEYESPADEIAFLHHAGIADVPERLWRGKGCDECRSTGYRGRVALDEILTIGKETARAIAEGRYTTEAGRSAIPTSLARDGADKAVAGTTTVAEARRVTSCGLG